MYSPDLTKFHETSRVLDFIRPTESLLHEFRQGNIADKKRTQEDNALKTHLDEISLAWDHVFPAFPDYPWTCRTCSWEYHRGKRDAYLKRLLTNCVPEHDTGSRLIVNPATVFGRYARSLARQFPEPLSILSKVASLLNQSSVDCITSTDAQLE